MNIKKRDTSKKRNAILDSAIQAFEEKGYENASMDYIAELSNSSKRTVYNHFPSKEALFMAILQRFITALYEVKQIEYSADASLESQLGKFVDAKIQITGNAEWMGIMKVSTAVFIANPELAKQSIERFSDLEQVFVNWLMAAVADDRLAIDNVELAAGVFNGLLSGTFFWPAIIGSCIPEAAIPAMKQEIIEVFLAKYGKTNMV